MVGLLLCAIVSQAGDSVPARAPAAAPPRVPAHAPALATDIRLAPPVAPWPDDMPAPLLTPADARIYLDGEDGIPREISEVGLWLPDELAGALNARLEALATYPARCQARLDALERIHSVVLSGAVEAAWVDARAHEAEAAGWAWWEVALAGVTGVAIGFAAGAVVVAVAK
jgi:hypothetical protein